MSHSRVPPQGPTSESHSRVPPQGPTLGSHPRIQPQCHTPRFHPRIWPQGNTLGSHPKVPPQGPTLGSHTRVMGPTFPVCRPNIKGDVMISPSLRLLLKVWVLYRCQNRLEKYYYHDGEQLTFCQKVHIKTQRLRKEECFCNLCIAINSNLFDKNRTQDNQKERQMPHLTWRKLT